MTTQDPDERPLEGAAADLRDAQEATKRADRLLELVEEELRAALEVGGDG